MPIPQVLQAGPVPGDRGAGGDPGDRHHSLPEPVHTYEHQSADIPTVQPVRHLQY